VFTYRHFTRPTANSELKVVAGKEPADSDTPAVPDSTAVDPEGSNAPAETIQRNEAQTETAEPAPDQQLVQEPLQETAPEEDETPAFDLSSPDAAVATFTKMFAAGDPESVLACLLPGSPHCEEIRTILYADPADPGQREEELLMRQWFQSLDPDADIPIVSKEEGPDGISVTWLVTIKTEITFPGICTFAPGDQRELDATVVESDGKWLIEYFPSAPTQRSQDESVR